MGLMEQGMGEGVGQQLQQVFPEKKNEQKISLY